MSKSKIIGIMALIAFAMGIFLVGDAVAGERGKVVTREVWLCHDRSYTKGTGCGGPHYSTC